MATRKEAALDIQGFQGGDASAFEQVVNLHGSPLRIFAVRMIRNKQTAEEIVSDTFLKLWNARAHFHAPEKIKAYLYITTKNACLDHAKSSKNRVRLEAEYPETLASPDDDTLTHIIHAELLDQVYEEVQRLPEKQAAVFRMSFFEGLTTEEICEKLGTTPNNVYFARSKAIEKLRHIFKDRDMLIYAALLLYPA